MQKDKILKQIVNQCFWDYDIDEKYLSSAIDNASLVEKIKIAKKIILNMRQPIDALLLFSKDDLVKIFENFDEKFKKNERLLLLENCLLNKNNKLKKYEWRKFG
ncbi:MAG: hypothetical protein NUV32_04135 [Exilispira sp.]|jgi:hypothetical protein|nr:hypothetical protein [Exilispira sp.]